MKKLSFLAVLLVFGLSTLFVSCGDGAKEEAKDQVEAKVEEVKTEADEIKADIENAVKEEVADYSAGKALYIAKCQSCHQANGEGLGEAFPALKGKACDVKIVTNGKKGTAMAAFKATMTDQEIADVINYVNHSFDNKFDDVKVEDVVAVK